MNLSEAHGLVPKIGEEVPNFLWAPVGMGLNFCPILSVHQGTPHLHSLSHTCLCLGLISLASQGLQGPRGASCGSGGRTIRVAGASHAPPGPWQDPGLTWSPQPDLSAPESGDLTSIAQVMWRGSGGSPKTRGGQEEVCGREAGLSLPGSWDACLPFFFYIYAHRCHLFQKMSPEEGEVPCRDASPTLLPPHDSQAPDTGSRDYSHTGSTAAWRGLRR